jgi:hypothetical protein
MIHHGDDEQYVAEVDADAERQHLHSVCTYERCHVMSTISSRHNLCGLT